MDNINHSERAHSVWSASSSHRWMACPASIKLSEGIPDQSSPYAAEGTCAHELAEKALLSDKDCIDFIGEEFCGHEVDEEMANYVQIYVDYVRKAGRGELKDVLIEERFDLSKIHEGLYGTNDACISEFMGTLEIIDLKYGKGVQVFPENNEQLMYYALGAMQGGEYTKVKLTIVQPRVDNPIKSWVCKPERIEKFKEDLLYAIKKTKEENPKMVTGDHCKFCKAKAVCPKVKEEVQGLVKMAFSEPVVTSPASLPPAEKMDSLELSTILNHATMIRDWLDSVERYAYTVLVNGGKVLNYKLVAKRSNRKYISEEHAEKVLLEKFGDTIYQRPKLLGIPAMEKLVGKELVKDLICIPDAGTTIAPESDKRPEVKIKTASQAFLEEPVSDDENFDNLTF